MNISEVSKKLGVSSHTLRYYEKIGLIRNINKNESGNRDYSDKDIKWIEFLLKLKKLKMPISEILLYSELRYKGDETINIRYEMLEKQKKNLLIQIKEINSSIDFLDQKLEIYNEMKGEKNE